jgi:hypothetical protein
MSNFCQIPGSVCGYINADPRFVKKNTLLFKNSMYSYKGQELYLGTMVLKVFLLNKSEKLLGN